MNFLIIPLVVLASYLIGILGFNLVLGERFYQIFEVKTRIHPLFDKHVFRKPKSYIGWFIIFLQIAFISAFLFKFVIILNF